MAVTFVGTPVLQTVADAQALLAMDRPAGAATGDLLVLVMRAQTRASEFGNDPQLSGFTRVSAWPSLAGSTTRPTMVFVRRIVAIASEPSDYTLDASLPKWAGGRRQLALFLLRGTRVTNPAAVASAGDNGAVSGSGVTVESLDSPADGSLELIVSAAEVTAGNAHVPSAKPSGFTDRVQLPPSGDGTTASRTSLWIGTKVANAGAQAAATTTWPSTGSPTSVGFIFVPEGTPVRLGTPAVTKLSQIDPSAIGLSDGSMTVSFTPVDGASGYTAWKSPSLTPTQASFTQIASGVTSPYTATGLAAGPVSIGIRAEV